MKVTTYLGVVITALRLIQPLPDQLAGQGEEFYLDVKTYFSEVPEVLKVNYPEFLSFNARKCEWREVNGMHRREEQGEFGKAVAVNSTTVLVLTSSTGLLLYTNSSLQQHFFSPQLSHPYTHLSLHLSTLSLYNSHQIALLDLTDIQFPSLLFTAEVQFGVVKVIPISTMEVLILHNITGISLFSVDFETGLTLIRTLNPEFYLENPHILDGEIHENRLYLLDRESGLVSLSLPTYTDYTHHNLTGSYLFLSNSSLIIDGKLTFTPHNSSIATLIPPFPYTISLFAHIPRYNFYYNGSHLLTFEVYMREKSEEYVPDLKDLGVIGGNVMVLTGNRVSIREYRMDRTVLYGHLPSKSGSFDVQFTASSGPESITVSFNLLIEFAALEVVLLFGLTCGVLMTVICVGCWVCETVRKKKKRILPEVTENSTITMTN